MTGIKKCFVEKIVVKTTKSKLKTTVMSKALSLNLLHYGYVNRTH